MCLALFAFTLVSCGDGKQDEPNSSLEETDYGDIEPTGVKTAVIYYDKKDGKTEFSIPGFPKFEFVSLLGGGYELWNRGICGFYCFNVETSDVSVSDIHWDGKGSFNHSWGRSYDAAICRLKTSKSGEYPERFVYARMRRVDVLHNASGSIIGQVIEYDSPYTIGK